MKKSVFPAILLVFALSVGSTANAEGYAFVSDSGCDTCAADNCDGADNCDLGGCCDCCCLASGGWIAEFEAMFLRYDRASGVNGAVTGTGVNMNYEVAPRITVGWVGPEGLGIRARYFDYEQYASTTANAEGYDVDVNTFDLELFERIDLSNYTSLEWSVGVRYNDYREVFIRQNGAPFLTNNFDGWGLIGALEANRQIRWGSIFARGRGALLAGDATIDPPGGGVGPTNINDTTRGMLELALGWEANYQFQNGMLFTFGVGYELQNWFNYSPVNLIPATPGGLIPPPTDVGLNGFLLKFMLER